ncbi:hypothetical protein Hanom_Chr13g01221131 [Helianthus anomalus]
MAVTTRIPKAIIFIISSVSSIVPKEGNKFPITMHMKAELLTFASWSWRRGMAAFRSTENLIATAMTVRVVAFRVKNLQGNQNFLYLKAWSASMVMAMPQINDAAAT